ncbi:MAG: hypothetical protein FWF08_06470 [Oscillospiraceae bacterium]|nr:hypothetical protein [Oscillospiraceae bacterium]
MDFPIWWMCFFPLFIILLTEYTHRREETQRRILNIIKSKRRKGFVIMNEAIKSFIGKKCHITTMNATVTGVVESIQDNWLTVRNAKKGDEIINIDYISRIKGVK